MEEISIEALISPLLLWFIKHARVLPWRSVPTPYRVWVSEIMLQQTRVEAVKPYYERFVRRLPDAAALANCPEDELLKLWEGLGYYNRVRNMQKAAVQVVERYGGVLPADYDALLSLPGIGSYTAGAIASIAYAIPVPAVDGNVLRVLTRVTADETDIAKASFKAETEKMLRNMLEELARDSNAAERIFTGVRTDAAWEVFAEARTGTAGEAVAGTRTGTAGEVMSGRKPNLPGMINQALMELGATVCLPNGAPLCEDCPWREACLARKEEKIAKIPVKTKAKARRVEEKTVLILQQGNRVAIHKRPNRGLLAGLYELPNVAGKLTEEEALEVTERAGLQPIRIQPLEEAKHIFSHIEWHMTGYAIRVADAEFISETVQRYGRTAAAGEPEQPKTSEQPKTPEQPELADLIFVEAADARERYAIPSAFAAYAGAYNIISGLTK